MRYVVTVDGRAFAVTVEGERVLVDGEPCAAHLAQVPGTPLFHLSLGGRSHSVAVEEAGGGRWYLGVDGARVAADAVDERTHAIRQLARGSSQPRGAGFVAAPMAGLVVRVAVAPGDRVVAGAGLVVLEAMKMENELRAPAAATITGVLVSAGEAVEKGQRLVELVETGSAVDGFAPAG